MYRGGDEIGVVCVLSTWACTQVTSESHGFPGPAGWPERPETTSPELVVGGSGGRQKIAGETHSRAQKGATSMCNGTKRMRPIEKPRRSRSLVEGRGLNNGARAVFRPPPISSHPRMYSIHPPNGTLVSKSIQGWALQDVTLWTCMRTRGAHLKVFHASTADLWAPSPVKGITVK
jgi:hypothetical protein